MPVAKWRTGMGVLEPNKRIFSSAGELLAPLEVPAVNASAMKNAIANPTNSRLRNIENWMNTLI
jgi:hypothetical protein